VFLGFLLVVVTGFEEEMLLEVFLVDCFVIVVFYLLLGGIIIRLIQNYLRFLPHFDEHLNILLHHFLIDDLSVPLLFDFL
jgi:hypothetical protein